MPGLSDNARELFSRPIPAWVTVVGHDGAPHNSVVWVDMDGDDVLFNTSVGRVKERILRTNPTVSVSILDPEHAGRWASVTGVAKLTTEDGDQVIDRLAKKYLGVDRYPHHTNDDQRVTVRVAVNKLIEVRPGE